MGTYVCKLKHKSKAQRYARTSSRELILSFTSGNRWRMPDMVLHYVVDHEWRLPEALVHDLLYESLESEGSMTYRNREAASFDEKFGLTRIGYLDLEVPEAERGKTPQQAVDALRGYLTREEKLPGRLFLASFG